MNKTKIQKDSILTAKEQSEVVDAIFICGEKEKTVAHSWNTGEQVEAFYYKATNGERRSHKKRMLEGSSYTLRDEFELDFARWVTDGWELKQLENSLYYLPGNDEKGEKLEAVRDGLWEKIEPVLRNAGLVESTKKLLKELDTSQAREFFKKAVEIGFCEPDGEGYNWKLSKPQAALFAEIASEKLKLEEKWKPFEQVWGVKDLRKTRWDSKERVGKVKGGNKIEDFFKDI